jgi:hypothetical protein
MHVSREHRVGVAFAAVDCLQLHGRDSGFADGYPVKSR